MFFYILVRKLFKNMNKLVLNIRKIWKDYFIFHYPALLVKQRAEYYNYCFSTKMDFELNKQETWYAIKQRNLSNSTVTVLFPWTTVRILASNLTNTTQEEDTLKSARVAGTKA